MINSSLSKKTNDNILNRINVYTDLLHVFSDMELNSVIEFSTWTPMTNFPMSSSSFWTVKIYKGAEVGFNYFLVTAHTGDNSHSNIWFGTYGAINSDIVWKELI